MATSNRSNAGWSRGTRTNNSRTSSSRKTTRCAPGYQSVFNNIDQKISSYRTLANQTCGSASYKRPSPTTLSSFANWVNKGAIVHCCSANQISRWCKQQTPSNSPTAAKNALTKRFGSSTIKAVCCDKTGKYLIATSPTWKGKPFNFPK